MLLHMNKNGTKLLLLSSCPSEVVIITEVGPFRQGLGSGLEKVMIPQQSHSHLLHFLIMFPPSQLNLIVELMNGEYGEMEELQNNW